MRIGAGSTSGLSRGLLILGALSVALGFVARGPVESSPVAVSTAEGPQSVVPTAAGRAESAGARAERGAAPVAAGEGAGRAAASGSLRCAPGRNGGATDIGVTAGSIRLASTVVTDGVAKSLLQPAVTGMKAVVDKVNAAGGICGRRLDLISRNDSFNARLGHDFLRTWATDEKENVFALAVVPSAEGLSQAIGAGDIDRARIPVVGTDGMRVEQYRSPWVWPVGTATVSTMRIMANYAFAKRKARTFGIVYDTQYKFGREGAEAFRAEVERIGGTMVSSIGIPPNKPSYGTEVVKFNEECGGQSCDMVALLLLPDTAKAWLQGNPVPARLYMAGAQTLFTDDFARGCVQAWKESCHGMAIWTGYAPPIGRYTALSGVARYVGDVTAVSPGIDVRNQFLEGAYLGMNVLVEGLRRISPLVTRDRLRAALDSTCHPSDLASKLCWKQGNHSANVRARAFSMVVSQGSFKDWTDDNTGWMSDPRGGVR